MYAVIMAGGKGTRFWPKSRESMPKHLLDIVSEKTIIQETIERIIPLIPAENILIVTGASHAEELMRQVPHIPEENIIIEPLGRNTAPCIGLAALYVKHKSPDDVMVVLPADHLIGDAARFRHILSLAAEVAAQDDFLLTIGIQPTYPETGYGYLEQGVLKTNIKGEDIYEVKSIQEKPALEQAKVFLEKGGFYWNSGMFLWRADTILRAIEKWLPDIHKGLLRIESAMDTNKEKEIIERVYNKIPSISIDYGVMEKADNVLLVRGDFGWSDLGSWDALWEVLEKDEHGNAAHEKALFVGVDAKNSLIQSSRKLIALVGVEDLIVVEMEDSLLICKRGRSQDVKVVVESLNKNNMKEYL
ncbi:MAG TPA: mannose-1-phosphate guanylyltransferase [Syntrophales bacterium]|nr:mannose-1-phosphate guanylyltransferase [Syntrophales bacterium]